MTEFYKAGITRKKDIGQAKIIKSRKRFFPAHDSLNHILFHGGVYLPNEIDVVKNKLPFINPKYKDDYYYRVENLISRNGRDIIVIRFDTDNNRLDGLYEGIMYVDRETYAYLEFDYKLSAKGIVNSNFYENNPYQRKKVHYKVKYKEFDGKYHLYYATKEGTSTNISFNTPLNYKNEFVTVAIETANPQPIPELEVFTPRMVFSMTAQDYNENNWYDFNFLDASFDFNLDSLRQSTPTNTENYNIPSSK